MTIENSDQPSQSTETNIQEESLDSSTSIESTQISETTETTAVDTKGASISTETSGESQTWLSELPEDLRADPSIKDFKDPAGLAKSYIHLNRTLGNSVRIPSEDASEEARAEFLSKITQVDGVLKKPDPNKPEEVEAFYKALGRPDKPEDYDIKLPQDVPEDLVNSDELAGAKNKFHELGLNSAQADALVKYELSRQMQEVDKMNQQVELSRQNLKNMWGSDFDARKNAAKNYAELMGKKHPEATQQLMQQVNTNPLVYDMMAELGKIYQERGHIKGQGIQQFGLTPEEARAKISEIRNNPRHPVNNSSDPNHEAGVEELRKLYDHANPSRDSSI